MSEDYVVKVYNPNGQLLAIVKDFHRLEYGRAENVLGALELTLPGEVYPLDWFGRDTLLAVEYRGALELETLWFTRLVTRDKRGGGNNTILTAYDALYLLGDPDNNAGRIVPYDAADATYTDLTDFADDMMKTIISQNLGAGALDADRDISALLDIAADTSLGPVVTKEFAKALVLPVLQELGDAAAEAGTRVLFDIVCTRQPAAGTDVLFEFRTYIGQRGQDLRGLLIVGSDRKNLEDVIVTEDYSTEVTVCYAGGIGTEGTRPVEERSNAARLGASRWNRREMFLDENSTEDTTALQDAADNAIYAHRPRRRVSGRIVQSPGTRYRVDWNYGDAVTVQEEGVTFDSRVTTVRVSVTPQKEEINTELVGEADV